MVLRQVSARGGESPERNVWLGSDYGEQVPLEHARRIAVELGHPADVVRVESLPLWTVYAQGGVG